MIATIQSDIGVALTVLACFFGLVVGVAFLVLRLICRKVREDYRKQGAAKGMARKVATKGTALLLKRMFFKRW